MYSDRLTTQGLRRKRGLVTAATIMILGLLVLSCGRRERIRLSGIEHYRDGDIGFCRSALVLRFAPRLYMHDADSTEIFEIVPVFHPERPVIAYHLFLGDDALFAGWGKEIDHEILWVEYDPVTFKVADVATYWHRTVLRTDKCTVDAKASQQRPKVFVQWGQHGLLPLGWDDLATARPRAELLAHYGLIKTLPRIPGTQKNVDGPVTFTGSWEEYIRFTREVDVAYYLEKAEIVVSEYPDAELRALIEPKYGVFGRKKEWPWWSP
jgi:hypothetical protein